MRDISISIPAVDHRGSGSGLPLRVMLLTHGGAEEVLTRLSFPGVEVVGIFVETQITPRRGFAEKIKRSIRYDGYSATVSKLITRLFTSDQEVDVLSVLKSRNELEQMAKERGMPFHLVENYHSSEAVGLMKTCQADLGVIYGTNIIRESVFKIPRLGSINLHQGLAPYYRGGPPIFWELYNDENAVGLTVHFVEAKVDSGAIIVQETVPLIYDPEYGTDFEAFIEAFSRQLKPRCAELVAQAVRSIALGTVVAKKQDTTIGARYRLPVKAQKDELRRRLKKRNYQALKKFSASGAQTQ